MEALNFRLQPLFSSYSTETVLKEAELLLDDAEVGVTFWGNKVLKVRGCEGSVYLDKIAYKISDHTQTLPDGEGRDRIIAMRGRVQHLYADADHLIQGANWFTKGMALMPGYLLAHLDALIN
jgi:hypothetical protein